MNYLTPEQNLHARTVNGKRVLSAKIIKAANSIIRSVLLLHKLNLSILSGMRFEINPCDMHVTNKTTDRKQFDVVWITKNNKVSYFEQAVVDDLVKSF